ncbi:hypothetical protein AX16_007178 [Volvariella volvacea WC 439]|nr:hypothetical protein AX16_007178 [Volvariella volvacea WC 439]
MVQGRGIYYIPNASVALRIGLPSITIDWISYLITDPSATNVVGWTTADRDEHMWLIEPVAGQVNTYTIRNVQSGAYMDLNAGTPVGAAITTAAWSNADDQKWIITKSGNFWKIKNKATNHYVDLLNGASANGTAVVGVADGPAIHQLWSFQIISCTGAQVAAALSRNSRVATGFRSFLSDGLYLILTRDKLSAIWGETGLGTTRYRTEIFDGDDYALAYKEAVAKWGNARFKADGFGILCGLMFGRNDIGSHAYNWFLDRRDLSTVLFLEPQNGVITNDPGYNAYFGLY